jgi:predicted nucleic acid-binding protein
VIFVDTGFFFALLSEKDPDHARTLEVFNTLQGRSLPELLVTPYSYDDLNRLLNLSAVHTPTSTSPI